MPVDKFMRAHLKAYDRVYRKSKSERIDDEVRQYGARIYDAGSLNLARDRRIFVQ